MFVSSIRLQNFRCFKDSTIEFSPGLNVLIGENNSGKTAALEGLRLVFERSGRPRPTFADFHRPFPQDLVDPPRLTIEVTLRSHADTVPEMALVATWLTKPSNPWEAKLTYDFYLPEKDAAEFATRVEYYKDEPAALTFLMEQFLPRYIVRVWCGNPANQNRAEPDLLNKLSLTLLSALRNAEAELSSGRNALMKRLLNQILDVDISDDGEKTERNRLFQEMSGKTIESLRGRLDIDTLFKLVKATGAEDGGKPDFDGAITEGELLAALRLFIKQKGFSHPVELNGMGYNNLIYISLVLAGIQQETSEKDMSENAVVYAMLAIEEPEAHLHPILQARFLRFIQSELAAAKSRQVFLTTHSTHITSQTKLDSLICLGRYPEIYATYPGRCFGPNDKSKRHVEKFLDATKSNLLFLKGVILVEGLTELLLIRKLASSIGIHLDEYHVGVVAVGGVNSSHFAHLFETTPGKTPALRARLACVVDADPKVEIVGAKGNRWHKCHPYQIEPNSKTYRSKAGHLTNLERLLATSTCAKVFHGQKTLEYDLALANFSPNIITPTFKEAVRKDLEAYLASPSVDRVDDPKLEQALDTIKDPAARNLAAWATLYARACSAKGDHAYELSELLDQENHGIKVPNYIENAIRWACGV